MGASKEYSSEQIFSQFSNDAVALVREFLPNPSRQSRCFLGGNPLLPLEIAWPRKSSGAPLHFLAQIDLSTLPMHPHGLPHKGGLFFFANMNSNEEWEEERNWHIRDIPEDWRVIFSPNFSDRETIPPKDLVPVEWKHSHFERSFGQLKGELQQTYPKWKLVPKAICDWPEYEYFNEYWTWQQDFNAHTHKIRDHIEQQYRSWSDVNVLDYVARPNKRYLPDFHNFESTCFFPDSMNAVYPYANILIERSARSIRKAIQDIFDKHDVETLEGRVLAEHLNGPIEFMKSLSDNSSNWIHYAHDTGLYERPTTEIKIRFRKWIFLQAMAAGISLQNRIVGSMYGSIREGIKHSGTNTSLIELIPREYYSHMAQLKRHQMFGYSPHSDHIQSHIDDENVILLGLASDDVAGMTFGDLDRIEFRIHPDDLRNKNFDKAFALIG